MSTGTLYIVATPIGNLEDMTFRAVRILKEVDLVAAEDTRHSRKLLTHFGISKPLTSYFDHNKDLKGAQILTRLHEGSSVALVTDAGTPCISDPGYQLVRDAVAAGIRVIPVPGSSAVVTALSASGLPTDSFAFEGFLPSKSSKRRERLEVLRAERRLLVFYESPNRLRQSLTDILGLLGDREIVIARELTKIYEEFIRGLISEVISTLNDREIRGEVVLLVAPDQVAAPVELPPIEDLLRQYMEKDQISLKDAVKKIAKDTGLSRSNVYAEALAIINIDKM